MSSLDHPYHLDGRGRTASTTPPDHLNDLIEQVLFTTPGERVNRPTFGSGLLQLVFAPNGTELAAATQYLAQGALQQWLGDLIEVQGVEVEPRDARLEVRIRYSVRQTGEQRSATFTR